ncbi:MAG: PD40 domain-containing protein [Saprospiraceae bacterium]|jgi:imidazolonepropionase-like amidohydrolase/Tol biopolymer transport system component|nr:PD40 domain-containing protein [Saprospiraceae bacterium]
MQKRLLTAICLFAAASTLPAQTDKKKWDVSAPEGIPYSDATFSVTEGTWMNLDVSPDGKTIAFDLLGDIYTMPITGGDATCIRSGLAWEVQPRFSPDGKQLLFTSDAGGGDNIWVMNTDGSKARQVTTESFRLLNNPAWMPDGQYFVARKHFTSTRSLGAGEMWLYHISGGDGIQLTKRKNDQQDVNEPCVSPDGRYVYFSEDLYGGGFFQYNKDPLKQIFAVRRYDRQEGKIEEVTGGSGGACRPQISPDGKWLAFVRRVDTKTTLFVRDLGSGEEFPIYDGLDKDQQEAWTIFGIYPSFDWLPIQSNTPDRSIVIWAGGKLRQINFNLTFLFDRKGFAGMFTQKEIPFRCNVKTRVAETVRFENKVFEPEFTARAIRHAATSPDGKTLVFNAAGKLYKKALPDGKPELLVKSAYESTQTTRVVATDPEMLEYEPCFSPNGRFAVYVTWNDLHGGGLWRVDLAEGKPTQLPVYGGIFRTPSFSPDGQKIVYRLQDGDDELGISKVEKTGVFYVDLKGQIAAHFITDQGENPRFSADGTRILVNTGGYLFGGLDKKLVSFDLNGQDRRELFKSKYVNQWAPSPDGKWLAFTELHKGYVCAMPASGQMIDLSADTKAIPLSPIAKDAGYNLHWSADNKKVHYTLGDEYFTIDLSNRFTFLPGAPDSLPPLPETGQKIGLTLKTDAPEGTLVFQNARIITMEGDRVIENGVLAVQNNKIVFVGTAAEFNRNSTLKTQNSKLIDCKGKTIMPGMVDVHAHSGNFRYGLNPQKQWEYYANLAYGVTTMHDPSVNSEMAFSNAEMLRSGRMTGPRLYSTGTILYGADGDFKAPINSLDDARSTLRRTKAWGAFSVKSYNQPRRDQRQQVIAAARELNMEVVPEGGSFFYHNLSQVVDGHTSVEHNLPVAKIYDDVIQLWSKTKTHNTPTLIVCYGAVSGEYYFYQKEDIWKKQRLLNFTPRHILDERARHRTMIPEEEYENGHILVSRQLKKMQDAGININLGSHGQLQGLGAHWELWMLAQGGMTNMQALRCATLNGAKHLGMDKEIGSIAPGKLADLVVLDKNPLENIRHTEAIRYVMVNGRLYDADTLNEIGNYERKRDKFWFEMPGSQTNGAGMTHSCQEARCVCGH